MANSTISTPVKTLRKAIHASLGATYYVKDAAGNKIAQGTINGGRFSYLVVITIFQ
jgi:hypothetical protein